jgi:hypothetical protein
MLPTKFRFIWPSGFRGEEFLYRPISNNNPLWQPCLSTDRHDITNIYRGLSIDASYQVLVYLAKRFQRRRIFLNWPIKKKNCLWQPCLLTDQDEMCNLYRGPSIDTSYKDSAHLVKRFQRKRLFRNRPIRSKNCMWRSCL